MSDQTPPERIAKLEDRIEQLEATTKKMMPTRRDALKYGGAAAIGAAAMSGTASAGSSQVGTIGSAGNLVDVEAEDINVSDTLTTQTLDSSDIDNSSTLTTQDIVVNGTATGPFGGGGVVLEAGDTIDVHTVQFSTADSTMVTLYSGSAKDVLGGVVASANQNNFYYEFSDGTIINKNSTGKNYVGGSDVNQTAAQDGEIQEIDFLPPALDVVEIGVGGRQEVNSGLGAEVILKG